MVGERGIVFCTVEVFRDKRLRREVVALHFDQLNLPWNGIDCLPTHGIRLENFQLGNLLDDDR